MSPAAALPGELDRRFEALIFDWDGTAVPDRAAAAAVRAAVEAASALGLDLAVVSGTHVGNIDGQLGARPPPARFICCSTEARRCSVPPWRASSSSLGAPPRRRRQSRWTTRRH